MEKNMTIIPKCPNCNRKMKFHYQRGVWCCPRFIIGKVGQQEKYGCGYENNKPEQRKL